MVLYSHDTDDINVQTYDTEGLCGMYECMLCHDVVELRYTCSIKGHNLLCDNCVSTLAKLFNKTEPEIIKMLQETEKKC